jgi:hypothetical protein
MDHVRFSALDAFHGRRIPGRLSAFIDFLLNRSISADAQVNILH